MESSGGVGSWIVPSWTVWSGGEIDSWCVEIRMTHPGGVLTQTLCGPIKQSPM